MAETLRHPAPESQPIRARFRILAIVAWLGIAAAVFAAVEIQIEGDQGWAAGLPTWRIEQHPWLNALFGGRPITGYHLFIFSFMFIVFHFPLVLNGRWTWRQEALILGSLMLFWIFEDALWFILNPAFGLRRLTPEYAVWHPHWLLGVPVDYLLFSAAAAALWWAALRSPPRPPNSGPPP